MPPVSVQSQRTRAWIERILDAVESKVSALPPTAETYGERTAWSSIAHSGRRLLRTADKLTDSDLASAEVIVFDLAQMLSGFLEGSRFLAGAHADVSAPIRQAAKARGVLADRRNKDPQVQAFHRAMDDALVGKTPEQMASREFVGAILRPINKSLTESGFKEVSDDAVRRRLKKLRS